MQVSDPVWYEALQGNPLQVPNFTDELRTRIKTEALSTVVQRRSTFRRISLISISVLGMMGFILFASNPSTLLPHYFGQEQLAQPHSDNMWKEMIDSKYPDSHNEILITQQIGDDRMLIFTKRLFVLREFEQ